MSIKTPINEIDFNSDSDKEEVNFINSINQRIDSSIKEQNVIELRRVAHELTNFLLMVKFGKIVVSKYVQRQCALLLKKIHRNISMKEHVTKQELIQLIQETIKEMYDEAPDPMDSLDDFDGDRMDDLKDTVTTLVNDVNVDGPNSDKSYDRLAQILSGISEIINNPRLTASQRQQMEAKYKEIIELIGSVVGGDSGAPEKIYVKEALSPKKQELISKWCTEMGTRKAAIRIIDSILKAHIGLGTDDLSDTTIFADGVDTVEDLLNSHSYKQAFEAATETAKEMIADEGGGDDLMEDEEWNEIKTSVEFKEVILKEIAPPGDEAKVMSLKKSYRSQHPDWSEKKVVSAAIATAWKQHK